MTIDELWRRYEAWAANYYRKPGQGRCTGELSNLRDAMRPVLAAFGATPAEEFTPRKLKDVRAGMEAGGALCRRTINARMFRVRRVFRWGVEEELVPATVIHGLDAVASLKANRGLAPERPPVRAAKWADIEATLPHLPSDELRAMVQIQWFTGMRPGELVIMRPGDVDRTTTPWTYRPSEYKTQHLAAAGEHLRPVEIGPRAAELLAPFLLRMPLEWCFKTRLGSRFTTNTFAQAVRRASDAAGRRWCPLQVRHATATRLAREADPETARVVLGHRSLSTTAIYIDRDTTRASDAMARLG